MTEYSERFKTFWSLYPKYRRKGKAAAYSSWLKQQCETKHFHDIIKHLQERVKRDKEWLKDNGKFVPMPTTFINQHRWEDEYETYEPKSAPEKTSYTEIDTGVDLPPMVAYANTIMLKYIWAQKGRVTEPMVANMVKIKNEFAAVLRDDKSVWEQGGKEILAKLYRRFDAVMERHA